MPTEFIYLTPFAFYALTTIATGAAYFKWDIGSIHIHVPRRIWTASLAPTMLSLIVGLVGNILWYFHIRPIAAINPRNHFISEACALSISSAVTLYLAFDKLMRTLLSPGFLRYHDRNALLPR